MLKEHWWHTFSSVSWSSTDDSSQSYNPKPATIRSPRTTQEGSIRTAPSVAGGDETVVLGGKSASVAAGEAVEDGVADIAAEGRRKRRWLGN